MTSSVKVPFLDLVSLHAELKDELTEVFRSALDTAGFIGGPMVEGFEREFARYCETAYCVGAGSGTSALKFALVAAGVQPGDTVVTVPNTFIATTEAITQAGAHFVFVDVEEGSYNMSPRALQEYLEGSCEFDSHTGRLQDRRNGSHVSAIVPVHLYGQMADMDPILELAGRYGLMVIEDACQAHGARYFSKKENRWRKAGSMGKAAAFSFYPGKNLGACGEAGAITTNDADVAKTARMLRDHGQAAKYHHDIEGDNGRLDAIQAGILSVKLKRLPGWNEQRRQCAATYRTLLSEAGLGRLAVSDSAVTEHVYHLYVVRVPDRDKVQRELNEAGVGTGIHYPIPLHQQKAYAGLRQGSDCCFPVTESAAPEILSLPMYPGLSLEQQRCVVDRLAECAEKNGWADRCAAPTMAG